MSHPVLKDLVNNVEIALDKGKLLKVTAAKGSKFAIIDKDTGLPVLDVDLKVVGDDLLVESKDGDVKVLIEDFAQVSDGDPRSVFVTTLESQKQMTEVTVALTAEHIRALSGEGETLTLSDYRNGSKDDNDEIVSALFAWGAVILFGSAFVLMNRNPGRSYKGKFNFVDDWYGDADDDGGNPDPGKPHNPNNPNNPNIPPTPDTNTEGSVKIERDATQKGVLVAKVEDKDGVDKVTEYQWLRNGKPIANANGETYKLSKDDLDAEITVKATYKDGKGKTETHESNAITPDSNDITTGGGSSSHHVFTIGQVAGDGVLDKDESQNEGLVIKGSTDMSKQDVLDKKPVVKVNGQPISSDGYDIEVVNGTWTLTVKPQALGKALKDVPSMAGNVPVEIEMGDLPTAKGEFGLDKSVIQPAFTIENIAGDKTIDADEFKNGIEITGSTNIDVEKLKDIAVLTIGGKDVDGVFGSVVVDNGKWTVKIGGAKLAELKKAGILVEGKNSFDVDINEAGIDPAPLDATLDLGGTPVNPPNPPLTKTVTIKTIAGDDIIDSSEFDKGFQIKGTIENMDEAVFLSNNPVLTVGGQKVGISLKKASWDGKEWTLDIGADILSQLKNAGAIVNKTRLPFDVALDDATIAHNGKQAEIKLDLTAIISYTAWGDHKLTEQELPQGMKIAGTLASKSTFADADLRLFIGGQRIDEIKFPDVALKADPGKGYTWELVVSAKTVEALRNEGVLVNGKEVKVAIAKADNTAEPIGESKVTLEIPNSVTIEHTAGTDNALDTKEFNPADKTGSGMTVSGATKLSEADLKALKPFVRIQLGNAQHDIEVDAGSINFTKDPATGENHWSFTIPAGELAKAKDAGALADGKASTVSVFPENGQAALNSGNDTVTPDFGGSPVNPPNPPLTKTVTIKTIAGDDIIDSSEFDKGFQIKGTIENMDEAVFLSNNPVLTVGGQKVGISLKKASWDGKEWTLDIGADILSQLKNAGAIVNKTRLPFDVALDDASIAHNGKQAEIKLDLTAIISYTAWGDHKLTEQELSQGMKIAGTLASKSTFADADLRLFIGGQRIDEIKFPDVALKAVPGKGYTWEFVVSAKTVEALRNEGVLVNGKEVKVAIAKADNTADPVGESKVTLEIPNSVTIEHTAGTDNALDTKEFNPADNTGSGMTVSGATKLSEADLKALKPFVRIQLGNAQHDVEVDAGSINFTKDPATGENHWSFTIPAGELAKAKDAGALADGKASTVSVLPENGHTALNSGNDTVTPDFGGSSVNPPNPPLTKTVTIKTIAGDDIIDSSEFDKGFQIKGTIENMDEAVFLSNNPVLTVGGQKVGISLKKASWDGKEWTLDIGADILSQLKNAGAIVNKMRLPFDVALDDASIAHNGKQAEIKLDLTAIISYTAWGDHKLTEQELSQGMKIAGTLASKSTFADADLRLFIGGQRIDEIKFPDVALKADPGKGYTWEFVVSAKTVEALRNEGILVNGKEVKVAIAKADNTAEPVGESKVTLEIPNSVTIEHTAGTDNALDTKEFNPADKTGSGMTVSGATKLSEADLKALKPFVRIQLGDDQRDVEVDVDSIKVAKDPATGENRWSMTISAEQLAQAKDAGALANGKASTVSVLPQGGNAPISSGKDTVTPDFGYEFTIKSVAGDEVIDAKEYGKGITITGATNMPIEEFKNAKPVLKVAGEIVENAFDGVVFNTDHTEWSITLSGDVLKTLKDGGLIKNNQSSEFKVEMSGDPTIDSQKKDVKLLLDLKVNIVSTAFGDNDLSLEEFAKGMLIEGKADDPDFFKNNALRLYIGGKEIDGVDLTTINVDAANNNSWKLELSADIVKTLRSEGKLVNEEAAAVVIAEKGNQGAPLGQSSVTLKFDRVAHIQHTAAGDEELSLDEYLSQGMKITGTTMLTKEEFMAGKPEVSMQRGSGPDKRIAIDPGKLEFTSNQDGGFDWSYTIDVPTLADLRKSGVLFANDEAMVSIAGSGLQKVQSDKPLPVTLKLPPELTLYRVTSDSTIDAGEFRDGIVVTGRSRFTKDELIWGRAVLTIGNGKVPVDADTLEVAADGIWSVKVSSDTLKELKDSKSLVNGVSSKVEFSVGGEVAEERVILDIPKGGNTFTIENTAGIDNILDSDEYNGDGMRISGFTDLGHTKAEEIQISFGDQIFKKFGEKLPDGASWGVFPGNKDWDLVISNKTTQGKGLLDELVEKKMLVEDVEVKVTIEVKGVAEPAIGKVTLDLDSSGQAVVKPYVKISSTADMDNIIDKAEFEDTGMIIRGSTNVQNGNVSSDDVVVEINGKSFHAAKPSPTVNIAFEFDINDNGLFTITFDKDAVALLKKDGTLVDRADSPGAAQGKASAVVVKIGSTSSEAAEVFLDTGDDQGGNQPSKPASPGYIKIAHAAGSDEIYQPNGEDSDGLVITGLTNIEDKDLIREVSINGKACDAEDIQSFTIDKDGVFTIVIKSTSDKLNGLKADDNIVTISGERSQDDKFSDKAEFKYDEGNTPVKVDPYISITMSGGDDYIVDVDEWQKDGFTVKGITNLGKDALEAGDYKVMIGRLELVDHGPIVLNDDNNGLWTMRIEPSHIASLMDQLKGTDTYIEIRLTNPPQNFISEALLIEFEDDTGHVANEDKYIRISNTSGDDDVLSSAEYRGAGLVINGKTNIEDGKFLQDFALQIGDDEVPADALANLSCVNGSWSVTIPGEKLGSYDSGIVLEIVAKVRNVSFGNQPVQDVSDEGRVTIDFERSFTLATTSDTDNTLDAKELDETGIVLRGYTNVSPSYFGKKDVTVTITVYGQEFKVDDFSQNVNFADGTWSYTIDSKADPAKLRAIKDAMANNPDGEVQISVSGEHTLSAFGKIKYLDDSSAPVFKPSISIANTAGGDDTLDDAELNQTGMLITGSTNYGDFVDFLKSQNRGGVYINETQIKSQDIEVNYKDGSFTILVSPNALNEKNIKDALAKGGPVKVKIAMLNSSLDSLEASAESNVTYDASAVPAPSKQYISVVSVAGNGVVEKTEYDTDGIVVAFSTNIPKDELSSGLSEVTISWQDSSNTVSKTFKIKDLALSEGPNSVVAGSFKIAADELKGNNLPDGETCVLKISLGGVAGGKEFDTDLQNVAPTEPVFTLERTSGEDNVFDMNEYVAKGIKLSGKTDISAADKGKIQSITISNPENTKSTTFDLSDPQNANKLELDEAKGTWSFSIPVEDARRLFGEGVFANGVNSKVAIKVEGAQDTVGGILTKGIEEPFFKVAHTAGDDNIVSSQELQGDIVMTGSTNIPHLGDNLGNLIIKLGGKELDIAKDVKVEADPNGGFWKITVSQDKIKQLQDNGLLKEDVTSEVEFIVNGISAPVKADITQDADMSSAPAPVVAKYMKLLNSAGTDDILDKLEYAGVGLVMNGVTNMELDDVFGAKTEIAVNFSKLNSDGTQATRQLMVSKDDLSVEGGLWRLTIGGDRLYSLENGGFLTNKATIDVKIDAENLDANDKPAGSFTFNEDYPSNNYWQIIDFAMDNKLDLTDIEASKWVVLNFRSPGSFDANTFDHSSVVVYFTDPKNDDDVIGQIVVPNKAPNSFSDASSIYLEIEDIKQALKSVNGEYRMHLGLYKNDANYPGFVGYPFDKENNNPANEAITHDSGVYPFSFDRPAKKFKVDFIHTGGEDNVIDANEIYTTGTTMTFDIDNTFNMGFGNKILTKGYEFRVNGMKFFDYGDGFAHIEVMYEHVGHMVLKPWQLQKLMDEFGVGQKVVTIVSPQGEEIANSTVSIRPDLNISYKVDPRKTYEVSILSTAGKDNVVDKNEYSEGFELVAKFGGLDMDKFEEDRGNDKVYVRINGNKVDEGYYTATRDGLILKVKFSKDHVKDLGLKDQETMKLELFVGDHNSLYCVSDITLNLGDGGIKPPRPFFEVVHTSGDDDVINHAEYDRTGSEIVFHTNIDALKEGKSLKVVFGDHEISAPIVAVDKDNGMYKAVIDSYDIKDLEKRNLLVKNQANKFKIVTPIGDIPAEVLFKPDDSSSTAINFNIVHTGGLDDVVDYSEYHSKSEKGGIRIWGTTNYGEASKCELEVFVNGVKMPAFVKEIDDAKGIWSVYLKGQTLEENGVPTNGEMPVLIKFNKPYVNIPDAQKNVTLDLTPIAPQKNFRLVNTAGEDSYVSDQEFKNEGMVINGAGDYSSSELANANFKLEISGNLIDASHYSLTADPAKGTWKCVISGNELDALREAGLLRYGFDENVKVSLDGHPDQLGTVTIFKKPGSKDPDGKPNITPLFTSIDDNVISLDEFHNGGVMIVGISQNIGPRDFKDFKANLKIGDQVFNDLPVFNNFDKGTWIVAPDPETAKKLVVDGNISRDPSNKTPVSIEMFDKEGKPVESILKENLTIYADMTFPYKIYATSVPGYGQADNVIKPVEYEYGAFGIMFERTGRGEPGIPFDQYKFTLKIGGVVVSPDLYVVSADINGLDGITIKPEAIHRLEKIGVLIEDVVREVEVTVEGDNMTHVMKSDIMLDLLPNVGPKCEIIHTSGEDSVIDLDEFKTTGSKVLIKSNLTKQHFENLSITIGGGKVELDPAKDVVAVKDSAGNDTGYWNIFISPATLAKLKSEKLIEDGKSSKLVLKVKGTDIDIEDEVSLNLVPNNPYFTFDFTSDGNNVIDDKEFAAKEIVLSGRTNIPESVFLGKSVTLAVGGYAVSVSNEDIKIDSEKGIWKLRLPDAEFDKLVAANAIPNKVAKEVDLAIDGIYEPKPGDEKPTITLIQSSIKHNFTIVNTAGEDSVVSYGELANDGIVIGGSTDLDLAGMKALEPKLHVGSKVYGSDFVKERLAAAQGGKWTLSLNSAEARQLMDEGVLVNGQSADVRFEFAQGSGVEDATGKIYLKIPEFALSNLGGDKMIDANEYLDNGLVLSGVATFDKAFLASNPAIAVSIDGKALPNVKASDIVVDEAGGAWSLHVGKDELQALKLTSKKSAKVSIKIGILPESSLDAEIAVDRPVEFKVLSLAGGDDVVDAKEFDEGYNITGVSNQGLDDLKAMTWSLSVGGKPIDISEAVAKHLSVDPATGIWSLPIPGKALDNKDILKGKPVDVTLEWGDSPAPTFTHNGKITIEDSSAATPNPFINIRHTAGDDNVIQHSERDAGFLVSGGTNMSADDIVAKGFELVIGQGSDATRITMEKKFLDVKNGEWTYRFDADAIADLQLPEGQTMLVRIMDGGIQAYAFGQIMLEKAPEPMFTLVNTAGGDDKLSADEYTKDGMLLSGKTDLGKDEIIALKPILKVGAGEDAKSIALDDPQKLVVDSTTNTWSYLVDAGDKLDSLGIAEGADKLLLTIQLGDKTVIGQISRDKAPASFTPKFSLELLAGKDNVLDDVEFSNTGMTLSGFTNLTKQQILDESPVLEVGGLKIPFDGTLDVTQDGAWSFTVPASKLASLNISPGESGKAKISFGADSALAEVSANLVRKTFKPAVEPKLEITATSDKDNIVDAGELANGSIVRGVTNYGKDSILRQGLAIKVGNEVHRIPANGEGLEVNENAGTWSYLVPGGVIKAWKEHGAIKEGDPSPLVVILGPDAFPLATSQSTIALEKPQLPPKPTNFTLVNTAGDDNVLTTDELDSGGMRLSGFTDLSAADLAEHKTATITVTHKDGSKATVEIPSDSIVFESGNAWSLLLGKDDVARLALEDNHKSPLEIKLGDLKSSVSDVTLKPSKPAMKAAFELRHTASGDDIISDEEFDDSGMTVQGWTNLSLNEVVERKLTISFGGRSYQPDGYEISFSDITGLWGFTIPSTHLQEMLADKKISNGVPSEVTVSLDGFDDIKSPATLRIDDYSFAISHTGGADDVVSVDEYKGAGMVIGGSTDLDAQSLAKRGLALRIGGKLVEGVTASDVEFASQGQWQLVLDKAKLDGLIKGKHLESGMTAKVEIVIGESDVYASNVTVMAPEKRFDILHTSGGDNKLSAREYLLDGLVMSGSTDMDRDDLSNAKLTLKIGGLEVPGIGAKNVTLDEAKHTWSLTLDADKVAELDAKGLLSGPKVQVSIEIDGKEVSSSGVEIQKPSFTMINTSGDDDTISTGEYLDSGSTIRGKLDVNPVELNKPMVVKLGGKDVPVDAKSVSWDSASGVWTVSFGADKIMGLDKDGHFLNGKPTPVEFHIGDNLVAMGEVTVDRPSFSLVSVAGGDNAVSAVEHGSAVPLAIAGQGNIDKAAFQKLFSELLINGKRVDFVKAENFQFDSNHGWKLDIAHGDFISLVDKSIVNPNGDNNFSIVLSKLPAVSGSFKVMSPEFSLAHTSGADNVVSTGENSIVLTGKTNFTQKELAGMGDIKCELLGKSFSMDASKIKVSASDGSWTYEISGKDYDSIKKLVESSQEGAEIAIVLPSLSLPKSNSVGISFEGERNFAITSSASGDNKVDDIEADIKGIDIVGTTNISSNLVDKSKLVLVVDGRNVDADMSSFKIESDKGSWSLHLSPADVAKLHLSKDENNPSKISIKGSDIPENSCDIWSAGSPYLMIDNISMDNAISYEDIAYADKKVAIEGMTNFKDADEFMLRNPKLRFVWKGDDKAEVKVEADWISIDSKGNWKISLPHDVVVDLDSKGAFGDGNDYAKMHLEFDTKLKASGEVTRAIIDPAGLNYNLTLDTVTSNGDKILTDKEIEEDGLVLKGTVDADTMGVFMAGFQLTIGGKMFYTEDLKIYDSDHFILDEPKHEWTLVLDKDFVHKLIEDKLITEGANSAISVSMSGLESDPGKASSEITYRKGDVPFADIVSTAGDDNILTSEEFDNGVTMKLTANFDKAKIAKGTIVFGKPDGSGNIEVAFGPDDVSSGAGYGGDFFNMVSISNSTLTSLKNVGFIDAGKNIDVSVKFVLNDGQMVTSSKGELMGDSSLASSAIRIERMFGDGLLAADDYYEVQEKGGSAFIEFATTKPLDSNNVNILYVNKDKPQNGGEEHNDKLAATVEEVTPSQPDGQYHYKAKMTLDMMRELLLHSKNDPNVVKKLWIEVPGADAGEVSDEGIFRISEIEEDTLQNKPNENPFFRRVEVLSMSDGDDVVSKEEYESGGTHIVMTSDYEVAKYVEALYLLPNRDADVSLAIPASRWVDKGSLDPATGLYTYKVPLTTSDIDYLQHHRMLGYQGTRVTLNFTNNQLENTHGPDVSILDPHKNIGFGYYDANDPRAFPDLEPEMTIEERDVTKFQMTNSDALKDAIENAVRTNAGSFKLQGFSKEVIETGTDWTYWVDVKAGPKFHKKAVVGKDGSWEVEFTTEDLLGLMPSDNAGDVMVRSILMAKGPGRFDFVHLSLDEDSVHCDLIDAPVVDLDAVSVDDVVSSSELGNLQISGNVKDMVQPADISINVRSGGTSIALANPSFDASSGRFSVKLGSDALSFIQNLGQGNGFAIDVKVGKDGDVTTKMVRIDDSVPNPTSVFKNTEGDTSLARAVKLVKTIYDTDRGDAKGIADDSNLVNQSTIDFRKEEGYDNNLKLSETAPIGNILSSMNAHRGFNMSSPVNLVSNSENGVHEQIWANRVGNQKAAATIVANFSNNPDMVLSHDIANYNSPRVVEDTSKGYGFNSSAAYGLQSSINYRSLNLPDVRSYVTENDDVSGDNSKLGHRIQMLDPSLSNTFIGLSKSLYANGFKANAIKMMQQPASADTLHKHVTDLPETVEWPAAGYFPKGLLPGFIPGKNTGISWNFVFKGPLDHVKYEPGNIKASVAFYKNGVLLGEQNLPVRDVVGDFASIPFRENTSLLSLQGYRSVHFLRPQNFDKEIMSLTGDDVATYSFTFKVTPPSGSTQMPATTYKYDVNVFNELTHSVAQAHGVKEYVNEIGQTSGSNGAEHQNGHLFQGVKVDGVHADLSDSGELLLNGGTSIGRNVELGDLKGVEHARVVLGGGDDVVRIHGQDSLFDGRIELGGGDDRLVVDRLMGGSIDGGLGHDVVNFAGSGNVVNLSRFTNVEEINLDGGEGGQGLPNIINLDAKGLLANALGDELVITGSKDDVVSDMGLRKESVEVVEAKDSPLEKKSVRITYEVDGEACKVLMNEDLYNSSFGIF